MDSYLDIAAKVLRQARQPLSASEILKAAYRLQIVPRDLYGRTQHKTLQARLSTDILKRRSRSEFYRTAPGRFFLRASLGDRSIPARFRREYLAPLRAAQLGRFDVVGFPRSDIASMYAGKTPLRMFSDLIQLKWQYLRLEDFRAQNALVPMRFLVVLLDKQFAIVSSRRSLEHDLQTGCTLGLPGVVKREDKSLFSNDEIGLPDAAIRTMIECLDLPGSAVDAVEEAWRWNEAFVLYEEREETANDDLIAIIGFTCTGIKEITDAVEDIDSLDWLEIPIRLNSLERFDRWSTRVAADPTLQAALRIAQSTLLLGLEEASQAGEPLS